MRGQVDTVTINSELAELALKVCVCVCVNVRVLDHCLDHILTSFDQFETILTTFWRNWPARCERVCGLDVLTTYGQNLCGFDHI